MHKMITFQDVQDTLDRILGIGPPPNHGTFWRGISRDEFVALAVYGMKIIVKGDPEASNLIRALRGLSPFGSDLTPPSPGAFLPRMPAGRPPASAEDIGLIEEWIRSGCPMEDAVSNTIGALTADAVGSYTDELHVRYWRAVDDFFLPGLSSEETAKHVGRMHVSAFQVWIQQALGNQPSSVWIDYLNEPGNQESFEYIRKHQQRLFLEFYKGSQEAFLDSIWKFGANLLPEDPYSRARLQHTMNGTLDWFFWAPHLDATLRLDNVSDIDLAIARGWQLGTVADGLLRTDADRRPPNKRILISDFDSNDVDLKQKVYDKWWAADINALQGKMVERTREYFLPG